VLSIPILLALVVGLIAYAVTLAALNPPSEEDIRNAPEDRAPAARADDGASTEGEDFMKQFNEKWEAKQKGGSVEETPTVAPRSEEGDAVEPVEKVPTKGKLRVERHNAYVTARKTGAVAFLITAGAAYIGLAVYAVYLGKKRPKTTWREAIATSPDPGNADVSYSEHMGYGEAPLETPPEPQADVPGRDVDVEAPFEPYEPPVDIREIEEAHDKDSRGRDA